ncbi:MAG: ABC transporter ATP-binding protein, partial [Vicinamibacteria bacterium]
MRLLRWFKDRPGAVSIVAGCLVVEMAVSAFVPLAFSHLIDKAIAPRDTGVLIQVLMALGVATILATLAGVCGDYVHARLATEVLARVRQQLFDHLQNLSPSFFQKYSAGDLSARFSTDFAAVEQTLGSWIAWWWKPLLDVIGYNVVMFMVDWRLAMFAQLVWPMTLFGPRFFAPRAGAAAAQKKNREGHVLTAVDEATSGRHVVRAFGLEQHMGKRFGEKLTALAETAVRGAFFGSALERSANVGIQTLQIGVLGLGSLMALRGTITVGGLVAFYTVFVSLSSVLYYLAQYSASLINSAAGLTRIEDVLAERSAVADAPAAPDLPPLRGEVEFRDIVYAPQPARPILDRVTLTIHAGENVAFVGPSGSGKTTVLNAIMRS